jgi:uncharacterized membrane protein
VLSCLAALQAPIILMTLNRHAMHNRLAAETDFDTNVNAETQVENLHRKIDSLRQDQWAELVAYQLQQIELLEQVLARRTRPRARGNGLSVDSRVPTQNMAPAVQGRVS